MKLAIVGTRGLPNNYGGFETLADYLVQNLSSEIDITVYCSSVDLPNKQKEYYGAKLRYIPISSHGAKGILYDTISLLEAVIKFDKVLFLGFGGGFLMPFIKRFHQKIIVNIGGLDWKRNKWSPRAQKIIKKAEELLLKNANIIVSDNQGIKDYIISEYNRNSVLIAYGGDQAEKISFEEKDNIDYPFITKPYAFIVTRIQSDNNIEMLLEGFKDSNELPLVIVGNWKNSDYGIQTKEKYLNQNNLILLDAIYERKKLDKLRSNCVIYVHGHSAGGTNPSLVEAMYLQLPIFAYGSGYNENTTCNKALYFSNSQELTNLIQNYKNFDLNQMSIDLKEIADNYYIWAKIAQEYKKLFKQ